MNKPNSSNDLSRVLLASLKNPDAAFAALRRRNEIHQTRERCLSLPEFVRLAWPILEPATPLHWSFANQAIAEHLEAVTYGQITRLLINVPPGFMKSLLTSVFWPAWEWTLQGRAAERWLTTSYKEDLAKRDARKMRKLVTSAWYQMHWPLELVSGGDTSFENAQTGWRQSSAITSMTGWRGTRVVVDDPHSTETAESAIKRATTARLMTESIPTRLADPRESAIVVIMQRLHMQDASGQILETDPAYVHLCLPMKFEADRRCTTPLFTDPREIDGELLDPVRFDETTVQNLEKKLGPAAVAGQFQQRPVPRGGNMFKRSWFEIVDAVPEGGVSVRAWDLAATLPSGTNDPDYTVGLRGRRMSDGTIYIIDIVRFRVTPGKVLGQMIATGKSDGYRVFQRIPQDPGAAGKAWIEFLKGELNSAGIQVRSQAVTDDKEIRALAVCTASHQGKVKLVRGNWNEDFLDEVCSFPLARHDDIVDALSDLHDELCRLMVYDLSGIS